MDFLQLVTIPAAMRRQRHTTEQRTQAGCSFNFESTQAQVWNDFDPVCYKRRSLDRAFSPLLRERASRLRSPGKIGDSATRLFPSALKNNLIPINEAFSFIQVVETTLSAGFIYRVAALIGHVYSTLRKLKACLACCFVSEDAEKAAASCMEVESTA